MINLTKPLNKFTINTLFMDMSNLSGAYFAPDIDKINLPEKCAVLLECACNLCANEMFTSKCKNPVEKILMCVDKLLEKSEVLVIVTNQVGEDGVNYSAETMDYIKNMGVLNRMLAEKADCVIEAVYGIPVILKGEKPECIL